MAKRDETMVATPGELVELTVNVMVPTERRAYLTRGATVQVERVFADGKVLCRHSKAPYGEAPRADDTRFEIAPQYLDPLGTHAERNTAAFATEQLDAPEGSVTVETPRLTVKLPTRFKK